MKRSKTRAVAMSGIMSALCLVLLYVGSIIEVLDYSVSAICGILVTLIIVEFGTRAGISVWIVSSTLALLILPSKFSSLLFIAFCGWYPFAKRFLERLKTPLCTALKFIIFNLVLVLIAFITLKVTGVETIPFIMAAGVFFLSNFVFVIYDILITKVIILYVNCWRKRLTFIK